MKYTDYKRIKNGGFCSVGKFGEKIYAFEILTGAANAPEFHQISREELDCFENWKNNGEILRKVTSRPVICSAYQGHAELDETRLIDFK